MGKILPTVLTLALIATVFAPLQARAQHAPEPDRGLLSVVGTGKATAKPDYASLEVEASTRADSLASAATAHKKRISDIGALIESLKAEGLELKGTNSSLYEDPHYGSGKSDSTPSFIAKTTYTLNVAQIDRVDALIAKLNASGLLEVRTVSYSVRDNRPAYDQARQNAVRDGRRQAEILAEAAGVTLNNIVDIADARTRPQLSVGEADIAPPQGYTLVVPPQYLEFSAAMIMQWRISPKGATRE